MTGVANDIKLWPYGVPSNDQTSWGVAATAQLYEGCVALQSGGSGGITQGYLKNMATPATTDVVVGIIDGYGPSCGQANKSPGIGGTVLNTADGVLTANVETGTFLLLGGTGSDALTVTNVGTQVYLINEDTVGATNGGSSRPVAGLLVQVPATDASIPVGFVAVQLGTPGSPWGGV